MSFSELISTLVLFYVVTCKNPSSLKSLISKNSQANFQNTYLGGILILVAFINASIDFYQIQKSEAILASFLAMIPPSCRVVRDGTISTIPAADLVRGDIVLLVSSILFLYPMHKVI